MSRIDRKLGAVQHRLVAKRDIAANSYIGFLAGSLKEKSKAIRDGYDRYNHHLLERGNLKAAVNYMGAEALVVSTNKHYNIMRYMRDPSIVADETALEQELSAEEHPAEPRPTKADHTVAWYINQIISFPAKRTICLVLTFVLLCWLLLFCDSDVVVDDEQGVLIWYFYSVVDIPAGSELQCFVSLSKQYFSRDNKFLFTLARMNHWYHRNATLLEQTLKSFKIAIPVDLPKDSDYEPRKPISNFAHHISPVPSYCANFLLYLCFSSAPISAERELLFYGDSDERDTSHFRPVAQTKAIPEPWDAYKAARCTFVIAPFFGKSVSAQTRLQLQQAPDYIPEFVEIESGELVKVDKTWVLELVAVCRTSRVHRFSETHLRL